jgi:hypothetical protein
MGGLDDILEEAFRHVRIGKTGPDMVERSFSVVQTKVTSLYDQIYEHFAYVSDLVRDCSYL